ncbi:MAG TPA: hypothetical protein VFM18_02245, partial [Methanosarcina sp.]|nr:hypothetical protein [Methanosarcina sp.]
MASNALLTWLNIVSRPTTTISVSGVSSSTHVGMVLAPVPLTSVSATGVAGSLRGKANVTWLNIVQRSFYSTSITGVQSGTSTVGMVLTPVPLTSVSATGVAGSLRSKALITWLNVSYRPEYSIGISGTSTSGTPGNIINSYFESATQVSSLTSVGNVYQSETVDVSYSFGNGTTGNINPFHSNLIMKVLSSAFVGNTYSLLESPLTAAVSTATSGNVISSGNVKDS